MSLLTDFALADHDDSYLNEQHPDSELMRGYGAKARRQLTLWGRVVNDGTAIGDVWPAKAYNSTVAIVRNLPTVAIPILAVVSDNAADAAAGTGARTIQVNYLDVSGAEHYAQYALNGTNAVTIAAIRDGAAWAANITDCWRVQNSFVLTVGANGQNVGNISICDSTNTYTTGIPVTASLIYGYISATHNISHHGFYTVPAGYRAQLKLVFANCVDASATVKYAKFYLGIRNMVTGLMETVELTGDSSNSGGSEIIFALEPLIDAMADIRFQAIGLAAATSELAITAQLIVYPKV
jgi:hypothetical protein